MDNLIVPGVIILYIIVFIWRVSRDEPMSKRYTEDDFIDDDRYISGHDPYLHEDEEEMFYHPTTGYKGTRDEMDAYIINRENEMKDEKI